MMFNRIIPGRVTQFWDNDNTWHSQEFEASEGGYWADPESGDYLEAPEESDSTYLRPEMMNPTMDILTATQGNVILHCERWNGKPSLNRALLSIPGIDVGDLENLKNELLYQGFLEVADARVTLHTIKTHVVEEND